MQLFQIKCFGSDYTTGSPALVISGHDLLADEKLELAKSKNTTCVYINKISGNKLWVDFYYPHKQSPLCVHGALAIAYVYCNHIAPADFCELHTHAGLVLKVTKSDRDIFAIKLQRQMVESCPDIDLDYISSMLGLGVKEILAHYIDSVGSPKLFIEIGSKERLLALRPNLVAISDWSADFRVNGIYVYTSVGDTRNEILGRNFNHLDPLLEDNATGVAAGALSLSLGCDLKLHQGINMDNPCILKTQYQNNEVLVQGLIYEAMTAI